MKGKWKVEEYIHQEKLFKAVQNSAQVESVPNKSAMRFLPVGMFIIFTVGCDDTGRMKKDSPQSKAQERMIKFDARIEEIYASVSNGMSHAEVVSAIGQPFLIDETNGGSFTVLYRFTPPLQFYSAITNGVQIDFRNGVVVRKSPIYGARQ